MHLVYISLIKSKIDEKIAELLLVNYLSSIEFLLADFSFLLIFMTPGGCHSLHHGVISIDISILRIFVLNHIRISSEFLFKKD
jgi:hypothetical protein